MNKRIFSRRRRNIHKRLFFVLGFVVLAIMLGTVIDAVRTVGYKRHYGTDKIMYININENTEAVPSDIKFENGEIYLPFDLVKEYIDGNIYRSEEKDRIIITTADSVIRMRSENNQAYVNGNPMELNMPVYDADFLPASVLEQFYPVKLYYSSENDTVTMTKTDIHLLRGVIKKKTRLKYEPGKGSLNVTKLKKGTVVTALEQGEEYTLVSTDSGLCGYVETKKIGDIGTVAAEMEAPEPKQLWKCTDGKANIVFDQITNASANANAERMPLKDGVDVICTTWFSFENTSGDIRNLADRAYVDRAHAKGIKVWGLITDNFDGAISHSVLSDADTREHVIQQLLAYTSLYNLDGINIDFESVPADDGELFVQFIRELAPMLHNEGVTLSADFFVPKPWTYHYNRGKCAEVLDYAIVMGYDQHYGGSETAGSNAEIGWSREAITETVAQGVPKEKLILGIPFYTRVWTINNSTGELSQKAMGMESARSFIEDKGGNVAFDEKSGQNYGEATDGELTYKCWLEDRDSVKGRLELVKEYDVAGVAAWKNGMETEDIWGILKNELKE